MSFLAHRVNAYPVQFEVEAARVADWMSKRGATPQCRLRSVAIRTVHTSTGDHSLSHQQRRKMSVFPYSLYVYETQMDRTHLEA